MCAYRLHCLHLYNSAVPARLDPINFVSAQYSAGTYVRPLMTSAHSSDIVSGKQRARAVCSLLNYFAKHGVKWTQVAATFDSQREARYVATISAARVAIVADVELRGPLIESLSCTRTNSSPIPHLNYRIDQESINDAFSERCRP